MNPIEINDNEFYLNNNKIPRDIIDLNYDVFTNFVPTNYQNNYINHVTKKNIYDNEEQYKSILNGANYTNDIVEKFYRFADENFIPVSSQKFVHNFFCVIWFII